MSWLRVRVCGWDGSKIVFSPFTKKLYWNRFHRCKSEDPDPAVWWDIDVDLIQLHSTPLLRNITGKSARNQGRTDCLIDISWGMIDCQGNCAVFFKSMWNRDKICRGIRHRRKWRDYVFFYRRCWSFLSSEESFSIVGIDVFYRRNQCFLSSGKLGVSRSQSHVFVLKSNNELENG